MCVVAQFRLDGLGKLLEFVGDRQMHLTGRGVACLRCFVAVVLSLFAEFRRARQLICHSSSPFFVPMSSPETF